MREDALSVYGKSRFESPGNRTSSSKAKPKPLDRIGGEKKVSVISHWLFYIKKRVENTNLLQMQLYISHKRWKL